MKDKVILDYLEGSYNPREKIKEILYSVIVSNSDTKLLTVTHSERKNVTNKGSKSNSKLLTVTHSDTKRDTLKENEINQLKKFI